MRVLEIHLLTFVTGFKAVYSVKKYEQRDKQYERRSHQDADDWESGPG